MSDNGNGVIFYHFDFPVPGRFKQSKRVAGAASQPMTAGATLAISVGGGVAVVGVALRSPLDQLWRKKGRQIALGRAATGTGRTFTFGVPEGWNRGDVIREAVRIVLSSIRWQDYPFRRWLEAA